MCGVVGFVNLTGAAADADILDRMMAVASHRGPDEEGRFVERNCALGVQRLSIVGVEDGHQPLYNETCSLVLGCNGEIFNYPELRRELADRGHRFRTRSDVEAVLHAYEECGPAALEGLNGQFAVAIIDRRDGTLLLARDRCGICPLFYTVVANTLVFGSEIKSLLKHPLVTRAVDVVGLDQLLSFPGLIGSRTLFQGVRTLEPGHYLLVRGTSIVNREYWDLIYPTIQDAEYDAEPRRYVERGAELFDDAVKRRLQADVPVGVYLSGGLDSSLIAAYLRSHDDGVLHAFSIEFSDPEFSEARYQALMAQRTGAAHHRTVVSAATIAERLRQVVYHAETPLKESYNAASLMLSETAHQSNIKVVLCGEGADELFAGYAGYRFDRLRAARRGAESSEPGEEARRLELWGDPGIIYERLHHQFASVKRTLFSRAVNRCLEAREDDGHSWIARDRLKHRHPVHQRSYLDFKIRLGGHLLADHGDRMAMANSVEARYPFLDPGFVGFATGLPPDLKLNGYTEKFLLKELGHNRVPREIVEREKFPFSAPGSPVLLQNGDLVDEFLDPAVIARQGFLDPTVVQELRQRYSAPGFQLQIPYDDDLVLYVLTFGMLLEAFDLPAMS